MSFRIRIETSKAVSLSEVARQIAYVAKLKGFSTDVVTVPSGVVTYKDKCDALIAVYPALPVFCLPYMYRYVKAKKELDGRAVYYTMVEGVPKRNLLPEWVYRDVEFIAVSEFTRYCLELAGLKVRGVIHHGYPSWEIGDALRLASQLRSRLERDFRDKVLFGFVGDFNERKGIDILVHAVKLLYERRKDFAVLVISAPRVMLLIGDTPGMYFVGEFGKHEHTEIMAFYAAVDYLVIPTRAEAFCLPVLEANALGVPAIATKHPAITEYASVKGNIFIDPKTIRDVDLGYGVLYRFYEITSRDLMDAMEEAIEIKKQRPSEYEEMKIKVKGHVSELKSENQYSKLIDMLGLSIE